MTGALDDRGFTLIELLVAMLMTLVIMGAVLALFTSFIDDNRNNGLREDATSDAQTAVDRMSRDLRNAAAPSVGASTIQKAGSYDLVFEAVSATGAAPSGNASNEMWVRYCLDGNDTLWRQSTSTSASLTTMPDTAACPSADSTWVTTTKELNDVTNEIGGDDRPLFNYGPTDWASTGTSAIKSAEVAMYVDKNPGHSQPGPTELTSGIYLRNDLQAPTAIFTPSEQTISPTSTDVQLNATGSSDPQGQALSYQWYSALGCSSAAAISNATSQTYNADYNPSTTPTQPFSVQVTDSAGLTGCSSQTVAIQ